MKGYLHKNGKVWYTTVDLPRLPGDKRRQKEIRLGIMSKSEAQAKEREALQKIESYDQAEYQKTTVADFLMSWLRMKTPTEKSQPISPKTYERYSSIVKGQLIPHLGGLPLAKLSPRHIAEMQVKLAEEGYSGTTCLHVYRVLHTALNVGVKTLRVIKENPASSVQPPKASYRRINVDESKVIALLEATRGSRLEMPIKVAAMSGLRRSEILALRWGGVDLERNRIVVSESLEETKLFGLRFKAPKSGRVRVVPLAKVLADALKTHKTRQKLIQEARGASYDDSDLVFCNDDGSPWPPDTLTKQFASVARLIGLKGFRLHDMRHAFASISLKQGTSVKEVSELLGHSTPSITMSTYAHAMEGMAREAVNRLADSLVQGTEGARVA